MAEESKEFYSGYRENIEESDSTGDFVDSEREYPLEPRCCITGEEVKHSFCRYPDPVVGTMMVMSRDSMLKFSRKGSSLADAFERVLTLRRNQEKRKNP